MKTLRLDIEYPKRELIQKDKDGKEITSKPEDISTLVILAGVNGKYLTERGPRMQPDELKKWSRIQDKMSDEDGKTLTGEIQLSDEQFDFLYTAVTTATYSPNFATAYTVFSEYLDTIKLQKEEDTEKPREEEKSE